MKKTTTEKDPDLASLPPVGRPSWTWKDYLEAERKKNGCVDYILKKMEQKKRKKESENAKKTS